MVRPFSLLFGLCTAGAQAQNLIPNGGFETQIDSPCGYCFAGQDVNHFVADWHSPTLSSPDYFSTETTCYPIPSTVEGIATAHSGDHMAGLVHYSSTPFFGDDDCPGEGTECIQVHLVQPLIPGEIYHLQAWLRLSEKSLISCDRLAFAFTVTAPSEPANVCPFPITADVTLLSHVPKEWTHVDTTFMATVAANYLTIGRFSPNALTTCVPQAGGVFDRSYYYIDDVSVMTQQNAAVGSLSATTTIGLLSNLVSDQLVVTSGGIFGPGSLIEIHSTTSQLVLRERLSVGQARLSIDVGPLAPGRYFSRIIDGDAVTCLSFVKQ